VTKPFSHVELLARIRAQGRRTRASTSTTTSQSVFAGDGLEINFSTGAVRVDNRPVSLSTTEYRLLFHLATNPGRLTTVTSLLQRVWRSESHTTDIVRVYISRLRRKIEPDPRRPRYILTKSGLGYLFTPADEAWKDS
jgi:two-component system KDP operon response regulator KdpE